MRILRDLRAIPDEAKGASLAIGNFDGLHPGHHAVLKAMHAFADAELEDGAIVPRAVLTFAPHPRRFFSSEQTAHALEPFHVKARRLAAAGVEWLFCQRFDAAFSQLSAGAFIEDYLRGTLRVRHVATGENFVFGHRRTGDAAFLVAAAHDGEFAYTDVPPVIDGDGLHASSRVRRALAAGDLPLAERLLGRPYEMIGRVRHGEKRGQPLGFPTMNLVPGSDLFRPAFGVYAVRFAFTDDPFAAPEWLDGVANFGVRPTFGGGAPWLEVHGLSPLGPAYGKPLRVRFVAYLRAEKTFPDGAALTAQIARDADAARAALSPILPEARR